MADIFSKSKWIWSDKSLSKPEFVIFYKKLNFEKRPKNLTARIACSTRYFFNISQSKKNKFVVRNGGMTSSVADYYDEIEVTKYFKKGENAMVFICESTPIEGGGALNNSPSFIFEIVSGDEVIAFSDKDCHCYRVENITAGDKEKFTFADSFYTYDATTEHPIAGMFSTAFASNIFTEALEKGDYDEEKLPLVKRVIPMFGFSLKPVKAKPVKTVTTDKFIYTVKFDSHKRVYPIFTLTATMGKEEVIFYGDDPNLNQKYICRKDAQTFAFPYFSVVGDRLVIETPKTVKLSKLWYISVGYGEPMQAAFVCDDGVLNSIFRKSASTLQACISDRFISSCAQGSFDFYDAAVAAKNLMIAYGEGGVALVRKMITDVLSVSEKEGTLVCSPLCAPYEDPFSGLLCISEFGFFAAYTDSYTDLDERIYNMVVSYLKKWQIGSDGLVRSRITELVESENFDSAVSENALYFSALRYARTIAERLGNTDTEFLDNSSDLLHCAIENKFFNGKVYSSGKVCDDRANAFIVLSGLALSEAKSSIATFLASAQNASIYTECYIIEALCKLGKQKLASIRLKNRYYSTSADESPSMPENFWLEGKKCCLHSAMPLFTLLSCFGGVYVSGGGKEVTVTPRLADLGYLKFTAVTPTGKIKGEYTRTEDKVVHTIDNDTKSEAMVVLHNTSGDITRTVKIGRGKNKIVLE